MQGKVNTNNFPTVHTKEPGITSTQHPPQLSQQQDGAQTPIPTELSPPRWHCWHILVGHMAWVGQAQPLPPSSTGAATHGSALTG